MSEGVDSATPTADLRLLLLQSRNGGNPSLGSLLEKHCGARVKLKCAGSERNLHLLLQRGRYQLLLCDYRSNGGAPFGLLHELQRNATRLPVVFLSDHVNSAAISQSVDAACSSSLPDRAALVTGLARAIQEYCEENQRHKTEDMLRKLWRAVEQTADLVVVTDRDGVMEYVNPAFEALTGYTREESVGQTFRLLKSGEEPAELYQQMWQTLTAGETFRGVVINRKKDGQSFLAEKTITPLRDGKGNITHFISTDRDITERRRLENQLQQAQRMDAIGRLAGGVAHDFNNLLMVIGSYAELMLDSIAAQHPLRRNAEEIIKAAGRAADLTRQLLAFGRRQMQSLRVLDLNSELRAISQMLPRLVGEDIKLVTVLHGELCQVNADPVQIEQVLINLAANARDAMPRGGTLSFETTNVRFDEPCLQRHSIVPPGDYVQISVTDSGNGIAAEHLPHIFEPFYTTKPEGKGTGLGLATVYGIVKQNSGYIWVYSEVGLGTTFKIYLPRVRQKVQQPEPSKITEKPIHGTETLLLVEDEASVRRAAREFLESSGYSVIEAHNGDEALQLARGYKAHIHLMISDVVMPGMGGTELAEHLVLERPEMKILFVSGYAESTVLEHGAVEIPSRFLQKPFTLRSLGWKVREVLNSGAAVLAAASSG
jgi:two-component system cell cycle sensor histidine kinase/response regulator CckA